MRKSLSFQSRVQLRRLRAAKFNSLGYGALNLDTHEVLLFDFHKKARFVNIVRAIGGRHV